MNSATRYQAVRDAMYQLGPLATNGEVAQYVQDHFGIKLSDPRVLSLYMAMVKRKMSRKGEKADEYPSGTFSFNAP